MENENHEVEALIDLANLKGIMNYDVIKIEGKTEIKLFTRERCTCLPRDVAHELLEECCLSTNREDYFWYLVDKRARTS